MTDLPNIISTKIVAEKWDIFWDDVYANNPGISKADVLVITPPYLAESAEEIQLKKMLTACNLTSEQYNILQADAGQLIPWHHLRDKVNPKVIILLGILPEHLGISAMFHLYKPNNFNNRLWIAGLSLPELEQQPDAKRQLWTEGFKPVFVDKTIGNF